MDIQNSRRRLSFVLRPLLLAALILAALQPASAEPFIILSQNMNRLFDDIDDGNREKILSSTEFRRRVLQAVHKFTEDYSMPQIIALQEVENLNVLQQIAAQIREQHEIDYQLVLLPGHDPSGINLGFMVQSGIDSNCFATVSCHLTVATCLRDHHCISKFATSHAACPC